MSIEEEILQLQEQSKAYKVSIYGLSQQIIAKNGDLRVEKNNFENYKSRLEEVKNAEKIYKKYSLYLQAVHRDGLPAKIIRKKLPLVNNKINSILSSIVNFKVEMSVTVKGDIIEGFYFRNDKSDMLPLSFASGSQKFISSIAIKDALHYMSNLIKPSLNIIDEGFGSLDDDLIVGIITVLQYLKNKYKNVIITTHRNEIKDSVDNIIEVYKTFDNITQEDLEANENAGITNINIS
jgi:DNA repair exonuclease SbcCD ATPase subunit